MGRFACTLPVLVTLALGLGAAAAPEPSCYAEASLEPQRAFLGQQVVYRVRIFRRAGVADVKWLDPPSFPSFRAEWLAGHAPDPEITGVGSHYLILEERRALFPVRSGELRVPAARARCLLEEDGGRSDLIVPVAPLTLRVLPLPSEGRPADFDGVIGPIQLLVTRGREQVELGETVSVTVTVRGSENVWRAGPGIVRVFQALESAPGRPVDAFASRPELVFDPGPRLGVRLAIRVDLVPRRSGPLAIPSVRVPYFDPKLRSYLVARTEAAVVEVAERVERRVSDAPPSEPAEARARDSGPGPALGRGAWIAALVVLASLALGAALRWARPLDRDIRARLAEAERAPAPREGAASLAQALRAGLASRLPDADALAADEILTRCQADERAREVARLLCRVEEVRFEARASRTASLPPPSEVRRALRRLLRARHRRAR